eukprot:TRINITY_DN45721_c0_g1_i1.p1 TRINITY_DN45721_c0_g1~~TRINITY_DN45721_c0_g1_i1.p1  ORF type:complete len:117 (-),score=45.86 TRINITY_DN45721_c0_g1_i1:89-439(-)
MICYTLLLAMSTSLTLSQPQAPKGYAPVPEAHQPFQYQYGVADEYSNSNFQKSESQDKNGNVKGSFVIALPDGRIQTTTYTATEQGGFIAEVTYQGEAVYPKETKQYAAAPKKTNY